jgi:hypothetical protein
MQQLAYATLVEDGERVVDEVAMPKSGSAGCTAEVASLPT